MARTNRGRGGPRTPEKPAPVSGPGALSRRTDGKVPEVAPTGLNYGDRKRLEQQMAAAPVGPGAAPTGGASPAPAGAQGAAPPLSIFRPTERPGEDPRVVSEGRRRGQPPAFPVDPDATLRAIYAVFPHPDIEALLRR